MTILALIRDRVIGLKYFSKDYWSNFVMAAKHPLGVKFIASIFIFLSGLTAFGISIEAFDSLIGYGLESLAIETLESFRGFMIFVAMPMTFYSIGVGLFYFENWARKLIFTILPCFILLFYPIVPMMCMYLLVLAPVILYFRLPEVKILFNIHK